MARALGRRRPQDFQHVEKYPYSTVAPETVTFVKSTLPLPWWHWQWDQGSEGACVGYGTSMEMSILNNACRYDARWLWDQAKIVDGFPDTNPGDDEGTTVRAACQILRDKGHVKIKHGVDKPVSLREGISAYRWATNIDEMRTAVSEGLPISIGVDWYSNFDHPVKKNKAWWIGEGSLGYIRGGHCLCVYAANDNKQAFKLKNSWGRDYPLVWLPYTTMEKLLYDYGEAALVTDRP